jgi:hypothetical protein
MGVTDEAALVTSSSLGDGAAKTEVAAAKAAKVEKVFMVQVKSIERARLGG